MNTNLDSGVLSLIQRKYISIIILSVVLTFLAPSFARGLLLYDMIAGFIIIGLCTWALHSGFRFQKIYRKLRPFIVTRILQVVSLGLFAIGVYIGAMAIISGDAWIPYAVFLLLLAALTLQFFQIFSLAKAAKKKYPDRCEFC